MWEENYLQKVKHNFTNLFTWFIGGWHVEENLFHTKLLYDYILLKKLYLSVLQLLNDWVKASLKLFFKYYGCWNGKKD